MARKQPVSKQIGWTPLFLVAVFWLVLFFLVPFLIVVKISFSQTAIAQPPYTPVLDLGGGWAGVMSFFRALSSFNYAALVSDAIYLQSFLKSVEVASISTSILIVLGYAFAYGLARAPERLRPTLLLLVVMPFWTAFLIRIYAWMNILQREGLLNKALMALGVISEPIGWLATDTAVYIGIVYSYLPFMVLPLYAVLEKRDLALEEAAADLGATPLTTFWRVTLPLSWPGVVAGAVLCFIPIMGEFVIPDLLGSSRTLMIGQTLWTEFFANRDWPLASAIAVTLLLLLVLPITLYQQAQARSLGARP